MSSAEIVEMESQGQKDSSLEENEIKGAVDEKADEDKDEIDLDGGDQSPNTAGGNKKKNKQKEKKRLATLAEKDAKVASAAAIEEIKIPVEEEKPAVAVTAVAATPTIAAETVSVPVLAPEPPVIVPETVNIAAVTVTPTVIAPVTTTAAVASDEEIIPSIESILEAESEGESPAAEVTDAQVPLKAINVILIN